MEFKEKAELTRQNIWQAIDDYGRHSGKTDVLDDVSVAFVNRLAEDSVKAKQGLREMFRKSPAWDEKLDALVINGSRTHDPDYTVVQDLALQILRPAFVTHDENLLRKAMTFFTTYGGDHTAAIDAINSLAPKAYAPNKKKSRIFKAMCQELGIADETAGSQFQRLYAQFADELSAKKIGFKLFVSLNPAHFITMSNPKEDERGDTMTSCHSFNSTQYDFNCGCSGYARDDVTMIAFTASDPNVPELLNNRKTTRQLFMYRPGNGLLLQSRMYNTSGGTRGAQYESKIYRDLVQREISECEDAANLWKTYKYCSNSQGIVIYAGHGFGGYPDWPHDEFAANISIRNDCAETFETFSVGTRGLCICCGDEISDGLYCTEHGGTDHVACAECGDRLDADALCTVYTENGNEIRVCESCRDEYYYYCECCGDWHHYRCSTEVTSGIYVCRDCLDRYYARCDECDGWHEKRDMRKAINSDGDEVLVCDDCIYKAYVVCAECGRWVAEKNSTEARKNGEDVNVCPDCISRYSECDDCGEWCHDDDLEDGRCPDCRENDEEAEAV